MAPGRMGRAKKIAVTGSRDLGPKGRQRVRRAVGRVVEIERPGVMLFGGARGVDTEALVAAHRTRRKLGRRSPRLVVVVPGRVEDQPRDARDAIRACADEVVELGLPTRFPSSYHRRNQALVEGADALLAFPLARDTRGTYHTVGLARRKRIPVDVVRRGRPRRR